LYPIDIILNRKPKMAAAKPIIVIARVLLRIESQFQRHTMFSRSPSSKQNPYFSRELYFAYLFLGDGAKITGREYSKCHASLVYY